MYENNKFQKLRIGLSPADIQILDRLEKLREDKNKVPPPSESEIRIRLANLKGENSYVEGPIKMVSNYFTYLIVLTYIERFSKFCIIQ